VGQSVPGVPGRYIPPALAALALALPPMFGHGCPVPLRPGADGDGVAWDEVADVCELAVPVEALAMVRPRARLAPRAPAPTAVPMSGRVILTCFSFASPAGPTAGPDRGGPREPAQISRPSPTGR